GPAAPPAGGAPPRPRGGGPPPPRGGGGRGAGGAAAGLVIGGGAVGAALGGGPWQGGAPEAGKPATTSPAPPTRGTDAPGQGGEPGGGDDLIGTAVMASVTTDGSPARAEMTRAADGEMHLAVHVPQVPAPEDGYLEVWIRDEAASRMISLGTVTRQDTTLTVPEGVDLASYPVLDVSHEHFDGDPSHSTLSLWVGEMHRTT
ncbi:anti-sigma factor domain-containing protein, partial [Micrococcus luteus]|uniref:anti-sigma factor domain-containing protein n=1 Tax=Micrococcus luteus TaxID=1270 RepID=UPI00397FC044